MKRNHTSNEITELKLLFYVYMKQHFCYYKNRLDIVQWHLWLLFLLTWHLNMVYLQLQQHLVTLPNTTEFTACTVSWSNTSNQPAVKSVFCPSLAVLLLMTDSRFNIWWVTWDETKAGLSECVKQGTPKPPLLYPPPHCPAIHRAEDRVLHSHSKSFAEDRNTMKSRVTKVAVLFSSLSCELRIAEWWTVLMEERARLSFLQILHSSCSCNSH